MNVAIIGAQGQLGTELCGVFEDTTVHKIDVDGGDHLLDVRDAAAVERLIAAELQPDVVINTAAAHNVPKCEEQPDFAFAVNAIGSWNVAKACAACGARLVFISTDYVFGNGGSRPYVETDLPIPLSVYGSSKLSGEHLVAAYCADACIVRTAALYGPAPCRAKGGMNFVSLMLHLAATKPEVRVVTDEITTPTCAIALARQIRLLVEKGEPGLYHGTCAGSCSWYDFAKAIFEMTGTKANLFPATKADFPSPVQRPEYSVLENKHLADQAIDIMPAWQDALAEYLRAVGLVT